MEFLGVASASRADAVAEEINPWAAEDDEIENSARSQDLDLQREWEARRHQFITLGYRDGISTGKHSSVQDGFNAGFNESVVAGFSWGVARGSSSAYVALPSSLKAILLKDKETRNHLEALQSTISSISSAAAMGIYYKDVVFQKETPARESVPEHSFDGSEREMSLQTLGRADKICDQGEPKESATACCGGDYCARSTACGSHEVDDVATTTGDRKVDGSSPQLSGSIGSGHINFVSSISTDGKQLEDSTVSHLGALALGYSDPSGSSSISAETFGLLEQYWREVQTALEPSVVKLSSFPQSL